MTDSQTDLSPEQQVQAAGKAFELEFERFARFTGDPAALSAVDLETAIAEERALTELRTRHLGKKSALAATKKLIGRVAPEARATFGQLVQSTEAALVQSIEKPSRLLKPTSINSGRPAKASTSRCPADARAPAIAIQSRYCVSVWKMSS